MAAKRFTAPEVTFPDTERIRAMGSGVLTALGAVREQLQRDVAELHQAQERAAAEHQRLLSAQEEVTKLRGEWEAKRTKLDEFAAELHQQKQSVQATREQLEKERNDLSTQSKSLEATRAQVTRQQEQHATAVKSLAEREHVLARTEQQLDGRARELAAREEQLQRQASEFDDKVQALEADAAAVAEAREALLAMQDQLANDHKQVAIQREELLQRLGNVPQLSHGQPERREQQEPVGAGNGSWSNAPKPAAGGNVDQFRKLRRDAKRKAIGV